LRSSGIDILPTVVSVAADEPDTAAKTVHPMILVCTNPPGSFASHGLSPLNMSWDNRVRNRISPIQMNIGRAVRVQLDDALHSSVAMRSPVEPDAANSSIPTKATPTSASPTQTPVPRSANRTKRNNMMT